jgi:hypothetical protein
LIASPASVVPSYGLVRHLCFLLVSQKISIIYPVAIRPTEDFL